MNGIKDSLDKGVTLHGKSYDYEIECSLGQGSFGITYLATVKMKGSLGSIETKVQVAIKEFFMKGIDGREDMTVTSGSKQGLHNDYKEKFVKEALKISTLSHSNIVKVIESFEANNTVYYAMEYINGGSLDNLIAERNGLSEKECISLSKQICEALSCMHSNGMLHLDLKPSNIMVKGDKIVLIDFGLSKQYDENGEPESSTTIGGGTSGYAPIEQVNYQGSSKDGIPAVMDIYALGATMFKMLTTHRPQDASIILNDGFPINDLLTIPVSDELVKVIQKCMEPVSKNRYKNINAVIAALSSIAEPDDEENTIITQNGVYKKATGDREYGTYKVNLVPVTSSFRFPKSIKIRLWDNSKKGKSYELYLTDIFPVDGDISLQNSITVWNRGKIVSEESFFAGISSDVKEYIIQQGFLSTEHWENEETTTPIYDDFGTDVSIQMFDDDGNVFTRRVKHAHKDWHSFLLEAVEGIFSIPSLVDFVDRANKKVSNYVVKTFVMPKDTQSVFVSYRPPMWHRREANDLSFSYTLRKTSDVKLSGDIHTDNFSSIIYDFNNLKIKVGETIPDDHDYSEPPGELDIKIESPSNGTIQLSLVAFNSDIQAGNIYGVNINTLAESLKQIQRKYTPQKIEPTLEVIYSIPDSTSALRIYYMPFGPVGLVKPLTFDISSNSKIQLPEEINYGYSQGFSDEKEFSHVVTGLRDLRLEGQPRNPMEAPTGEIFETLSIELYDKGGNLIKSMYAQDNGSQHIGNIDIPVEKLKEEIVKLSPSFAKALKDSYIKGSCTEVNEKQISVSDIIFRTVLFSIAIGIVAIPTYLFVQPSDKLYYWLWITIGITELFSAIVFNIGGIYRKKEDITNFETITFLIGMIGLLAYVILWIIQMCYWWI